MRGKCWRGGCIGESISRSNPTRVNYLQRSSDVRGGRAESPGRAEPAGRRRRRSGRRSSVYGTVELALAPVRHQILVVATLFGIVPEVRVVRVRRAVKRRKKISDQNYVRLRVLSGARWEMRLGIERKRKTHTKRMKNVYENLLKKKYIFETGARR